MSPINLLRQTLPYIDNPDHFCTEADCSQCRLVKEVRWRVEHSSELVLGVESAVDGLANCYREADDMEGAVAKPHWHYMLEAIHDLLEHELVLDCKWNGLMENGYLPDGSDVEEELIKEFLSAYRDHIVALEVQS